MVVMDLSSFTSVRAGAARILKLSNGSIDSLVHNAGTITSPPRLTADGLEETMQVNHFAPVLLTQLLLPALRKSLHFSRVVNVASASAYDIGFKTEGTYGSIPNLIASCKNASTLTPSGFYGLSKFLVIQHARALARREAKSAFNAVGAFSVNPGFFRVDPSNPKYKDICTQNCLFRPCPQLPAQGATSILFAGIGVFARHMLLVLLQLWCSSFNFLLLLTPPRHH
jgi:NAD(P)-dependent dehydrogenase (short-subunit alcohol dehydrogenase family)